MVGRGGEQILFLNFSFDIRGDVSETHSVFLVFEF